ncbi:hypothetical protein CEP52_010833 [Fusarium oligoseptatum]|uniref:Calcium-transporting ATPase n=1 Tax=Fusarium oligoseptatum TaxID=2604345 RepID=A0A428T682_9HYPO|nr:hypothetical protein CEP52_010833 [Fusarium oligoseptatum]
MTHQRDELLPPTPNLEAQRSRSGDQSSLSDPFVTASSSGGSTSELESFEVSLRPDPGTEDDFKLLNPKSLAAFRALGGLEGIVTGLQTDVTSGLSVEETVVRRNVTFEEATGWQTTTQSPSTTTREPTKEPFGDRIRVYNRNVLPAKKATPFWRLLWNAYNDKVLILLTAAAVISLALGLYETFGVKHDPGDPTPVDWVEGVAICIAIIIVSFVSAGNDWQKERAFVKLNAKKEDREVKVTRSGKMVMINVHDVLVGDILHLEPGDLVPVDGVFVDGHDLKCDESSATGESDAIKKTGGLAVMQALEGGRSKGLDPFIISGSKVLEGVGTFLCTSVGVNSSYGKIMMSVRTETEETPLQKKLSKLASSIAYLGGSAACLLFFVLLFRFVANLPGDDRPARDKASSFMDILIVAVTIIVVAVPEGLPLAVTLALAFATTKMLKENNLVRVLRACETMGNATAICSDKTGTLTTNRMTVVAGTFGDASFSNSEKHDTPITTWAKKLTSEAKDLIIQSVAINSTAFEGQENGQTIFLGSKTETALLELAKEHLGLESLAQVRANEDVVQMMPFDSSKKCMGAVIKLRSGVYRLLVKGASEILLSYCTTKADIETLEEEPLTDEDRQSLNGTIDEYARRSLRTIGLVYKDFPSWPPSSPSAEVTENNHVDFASVLNELVFLGVVGIQDPVRPGVPEAVRKAQGAGVTVRMVTGDNATTAKAIAKECGIYTGGLVIEGPDFRRLSDEEKDRILPDLQVLARSSPEDKRILVTRLKELGATVAVTGDGTNDAPALKAADIGFSMGISGTEVAKEASSIILMDDNFTSIITALKWGRAVNDAVQNFKSPSTSPLFFLAFVTAVYDPDMESVLKAVQLLWVNLIMDTFAALALATDPPTDEILEREPQGKKKPLITITMWKMIIGQAIYQLVVTFVLYFAGDKILGYDTSIERQKTELDTVIFNTFVWMQIFNMFNNRRLDNKFNIFQGVQRNQFFVLITLLMIGLQVIIIFKGSRAFQIVPDGLDATQWGVSVITAIFCLPWAILVRLFRDEWFAACARIVGKPFVFVYKHLLSGWSKVKGVFSRKNKKDDDPEAGVTPAAN